jgi:pyruvate dehydrogenase E1 component alpha subunit
MSRWVHLSRAGLEGAYELMARMRCFEEAQTRLWDDGLVPGEMHTGTGEEGIVAGVLSHLTERDVLALDHRATPALVGRGVDMEQIMLEVCGHEGGLNGGHGGHMHLFAPDQRAAGDGMVGASAPLACGLAMAGRQLRPGSVAAAFFGEGAVNEGYVMEAFNLAAAWNLPVLFVCKDNAWSITTRSSLVTGGPIIGRAAAFGLATECVDGTRVDRVYASAGKLIRRIRTGSGPGFLLATCYRPQGHFTTDLLVRLVGDPRGQLPEVAPPLLAALTGPGGTRRERAAGALTVSRRIIAAAANFGRRHRDPVALTRRRLDPAAAARIDRRVRDEVLGAEAAARRQLDAATASRALAPPTASSPPSTNREKSAR